MNWREIRMGRSGPRRHYYGDEKRDWAFVVRNGMNPELWDAVVYGREDRQFKLLREAKAFVERLLHKGEGGDE
jgi:hypothetical protein